MKSVLRFPLLAVLICAVVTLTTGGLAACQTFSVLYNFGSNPGDPRGSSNPGLVAQGLDGNLYSTAPYGGAYGYGAIYRITPAGVLAVLYDFDGNDGLNPYSGLMLGTDGNFYGTTYGGGTSNQGTIFKITAGGSLTVLHNFAGGSDGAYPYAPPVEGTDGNLYGVTTGGGNFGFGTLYKATPSGGFKTLHLFFDQSAAYAPLIQATDGNFYGTSEYSNNGEGYLYRIAPTGRFRQDYRFSGVTGTNPIAPLLQGSDGDFYGTMSQGGNGNFGVVFKSSNLRGPPTALHLFSETDGVNPYAGLVQASDGNFYGATVADGGPVGAGTIYSINPQGSFSVLYDFDVTTGAEPVVTPFQHTNGILYGVAQGGPYGYGTLYSLDAGLAQFVSLLPISGKVGQSVGILGQGFTGTTSVTFNGSSATFTVSSDTYLTATVPTAATTGFVTVTTPVETLTSNKQFIVRDKP